MRLMTDSQPLRQGRELLLQGLQDGLPLSTCPLELQTDKDFLLEALSKRSTLYLEMDEGLQKDRDIALTAIVTEDSTFAIHSRVLRNVPSIVVDREVVLTVAKRGDEDLLRLFLTEEQYRDDKMIMLAMIERDWTMYHCTSSRLQQDPDVILGTIQEHSAQKVIEHATEGLKRRHPEIIIKAIQVIDNQYLYHLGEHIPVELWKNRSVVLAWIRRGGRVSPLSEPLLEDDQEMALEVAEHVWYDFSKVGDALKGNVDFMIKAVDRNGHVLRFATPAIRNNSELALRAVANDPAALSWVDKEVLWNYVKCRLDLHENFVNNFWGGVVAARPTISPAPHSQPRKQCRSGEPCQPMKQLFAKFRKITPVVSKTNQCYLPMLNLGGETGDALNQLIAEFLDVPIGPELEMLRKARRHLASSEVAATEF